MKNSFIASACVVGVLAVVVLAATVWASMDASSKAASAIDAANMATQQSGVAVANASEARAIAVRADDKADTALSIANTALQVANNANRGELTAIVAIVGGVVVVMGLFGGLLMLIIYNVRNAHAIDMARLMAPPIYVMPRRRAVRRRAPALPPGIDATRVIDGTVAKLGEPMYLVRKSD